MALRLESIQPKSILVIKPSALGDICHSLPVLDFLRHRFPQATLHWVANRAFVPLLNQHPHLSSVIPFDRSAGKKGWGTLASSLKDLVGSLRAVKPDLVIDLQGLLRSAMMAWASGAKVRIGLGDSREGSRWLYTHSVKIPSQVRHAVDRYWQVALALGGTGSSPLPRLPLAPSWEEEAEKATAGLPRPWLVMGPGSRWLTKRWLPAHFATVGQTFLQKGGGSVILVGTPDEAALSAEIQRSLGNRCLDLTGKTSLGGLAGLLSLADAVLANDTGPLHLAVAMEARVVSPFTCTSVEKTGPYGQLHRGIATRVDCAASFLRECPHMKCMNELTPDRIWPALESALKEKAP